MTDLLIFLEDHRAEATAMTGDLRIAGYHGHAINALSLAERREGLPE